MSDVQKSPAETPHEWLRYAEGDLNVAEREMKAEMPVYHLVCFLSQGAAEKFIKGFLIAQGWELEKIHDIVRLLKTCQPFDTVLARMTTEGAILNQHITAGRYPGDIGVAAIGKAEADEALQAARRIRARVLELLKTD